MAPGYWSVRNPCTTLCIQLLLENHNECCLTEGLRPLTVAFFFPGGVQDIVYRQHLGHQTEAKPLARPTSGVRSPVEAVRNISCVWLP